MIIKFKINNEYIEQYNKHGHVVRLNLALKKYTNYCTYLQDIINEYVSNIPVGK